jgi:hypothetical protein
MNFYKIVINGYYIPLIHGVIYIITDDIFLSSIIALKAYPANYFYWFQDHYTYLPKYNWIKQFIRFTDTGHLVSLLYYFNPEFLPLAFNIHFVITAGYWGGRLIFNLRDSDQLSLPELDNSFEQMWSALIHGLPLVLLTNRIIHNDQCVPFDYNVLKMSCVWAYSWLFGVYVPWRYYTGDYVYNILDKGIIKASIFIFFINVIMVISHITGYLLTYFTCIR